jgi:hypothetical protein
MYAEVIYVYVYRIKRGAKVGGRGGGGGAGIQYA